MHGLGESRNEYDRLDRLVEAVAIFAPDLAADRIDRLRRVLLGDGNGAMADDGHRSSAPPSSCVCVCVCGELDGKPKIEIPETCQLYCIRVSSSSRMIPPLLVFLYILKPLNRSALVNRCIHRRTAGFPKADEQRSLRQASRRTITLPP